MNEVAEQVRNNAPAYCELKDDKAKWLCNECHTRDYARSMFYIATSNKRSGVFHKTCIDPHWLSTAKRIEGKA